MTHLFEHVELEAAGFFVLIVVFAIDIYILIKRKMVGRDAVDVALHWNKMSFPYILLLRFISVGFLTYGFVHFYNSGVKVLSIVALYAFFVWMAYMKRNV